jgi:transposase InsO family protein
MWQSDMTHWSLVEGRHVEIVNFIDDHSRLCIACVAVPVARATDVAEIFITAAQRHGTPASVLTDNGCIYTAKYRGGKVIMETLLETLGVTYKHSRPYHPQTCGKVCEHVLGAAPGRSDPGQGVTVVSSVRFVDRSRCCAMARTGQPDLT